ncbi:ABC transporter ATP-binding protein [Clostridioides difficile]|nr:ABC transporter ATP-binding protein [Clostridioides difficile]NJK14539.1 ABC transporter ATP-binding protein [Clostridioides difficile]
MEKLLELNNVSKSFSLGRKRKNIVVNHVNLTIYKGETLGLVGESGCGKSTLARIIMGVYPSSEGEILFQGKKLELHRQSARKEFAQHTQMIFQDPYMSLDPYMTIESIIAENLKVHGMLDKNARTQKVYELLEMTGLSREYAGRFPHEFSGGQRQRISIARALVVQPNFIICDEPVSALDNSIQSQIINLLYKLKMELGLTYLFISHDLSMVRYISDRIAVMYAGRIVEIGNAEEVYNTPLHPYTQMLLRAVLTTNPNNRNILEEEMDVQDEVESFSSCEKGCPFVKRCKVSTERCGKEMPELFEHKKNHLVACHMTSE